MEQQLRILIVEDNRVARLGLAALLEDSGYAALTAADGLEAVAIAKEQPVDLVISDVAMPKMDGFDLVASLRADPLTQEVPIILVSAHYDAARKVTGLDLGADDYLCKPIDPDELLAKVRAVLRRASRSQELLVRSLYDELTGVLNRRGILEFLRREINRLTRTGQPVSVFMVDIDAFKAINDSLGHRAGDDALVHVAEALSSSLRGADTVGRYGGDEFLIVAPDTDSSAASVLADRLRGSVTDVSVSVGYSTTSSGGDAAEDLIALADSAMYRDKSTAFRAVETGQTA